ncbi:MAG TPA: hypothetical protein VME41_18115 [Stellaceae bacterium]|nr:hypothetical protein [Stellaceae bacterium]
MHAYRPPPIRRYDYAGTMPDFAGDGRSWPPPWYGYYPAPWRPAPW